MPLKQEILKHLENTDPISAKWAPATPSCARTTESSTASIPMWAALCARWSGGFRSSGAKILVLGAGGAARAAVFGLVNKGAEVVILNRTPQTAQKLARQAKAKTIRREQVAKSSFDVIVNATAVGMHGVKPQHILEPKEINARLVFDLVYNPIDTPCCAWLVKKEFRLLLASKCSYSRAHGSLKSGPENGLLKKRCCGLWCMPCDNRRKLPRQATRRTLG